MFRALLGLTFRNIEPQPPSPPKSINKKEQIEAERLPKIWFQYGRVLLRLTQRIGLVQLFGRLTRMQEAYAHVKTYFDLTDDDCYDNNYYVNDTTTLEMMKMTSLIHFLTCRI